DARLPPPVGGPGGDVLLAEEDPAAVGGDQPHDRGNQFGLAVAFDPGDPDDLAGAHGQRHVGEHRPAAVAEDREVAHVQHHPVGDGGLADLGGGQLAADHQLGEPPGGDLAGRDGGHGGAGADHGDGVGDVEDLVQLVGDEDDGEPFGLQLTQVGEELL